MIKQNLCILYQKRDCLMLQFGKKQYWNSLRKQLSDNEILIFDKDDIYSVLGLQLQKDNCSCLAQAMNQRKQNVIANINIFAKLQLKNSHKHITIYQQFIPIIAFKETPHQLIFQIYMFLPVKHKQNIQDYQPCMLPSIIYMALKNTKGGFSLIKAVQTSQLLVFINKIMSLDQEHQVKMEEEQIMIMMADVDQIEGSNSPDLLEMLVAEPTLIKKSSLKYDYEPSPVSAPKTQVEDGETTELKTSNNSTSTAGEIRRCTCLKTRCLKNYCECFKQGLACTSQCVCIACCNKERLFLNRMNPQITKCKCQKSHCLKKYCECHNSGRKCGPACKCLECQNMQQEHIEVEGDEVVKMQEQICDHNVFLDI